MTSKNRFAAASTLDPVIHFLLKLQAEGWCLESFEKRIDYETLPKGQKKGVQMPMGAMITIRLTPVVL